MAASARKYAWRFMAAPMASFKLMSFSMAELIRPMASLLS
jgi:hypothetical protein